MASNPLRVALLRAVNVAGRNRVPMAELRALFEENGFAGARTLLQSGNVVFAAPARESGAKLERRLESATTKHFGLEVDYVVRTAGEWTDVIARNPLPDAARRDPGHLIAMCLKEAPAAGALKLLSAAIKGPEVARLEGRELYIHYPAGIGTSKLTNAVIERTLGVRGTARNWNTVLKLAAMMEEGRAG